MAVDPGKIYCDFCGCEILPGAAFAKFNFPIPDSLRREILDACRDDIPAHVLNGPINLTLHAADHMVPREFPLEACPGCAFGLLPDVLKRIREQVHGILRRKLEAKQRALDSRQELEPEAAD